MNAAQTDQRPRPRESFAVLACLYGVAFLAIAALIAGAVVGLNVMGMTSWPSPVARVRADMRSIEAAAAQFKRDTGRDLVDITSLWASDLPGWAGPYLRRYPALDPWGNEYFFNVLPDGSCEVISFGVSGVPGGTEDEADLSSRTIDSPEGR